MQVTNILTWYKYIFEVWHVNDNNKKELMHANFDMVPILWLCFQTQMILIFLKIFKVNSKFHIFLFFHVNNTCWFHAPCSSFGTHHLGLDRLVLLLDQPHALHPLTLPPLASLPVNTCLFHVNDNQSKNNNIMIIMK